MKKLRPLGKLILVKRDQAEELYEGIILTPEKARELPMEGIILETGLGIRSELKEGDRVLFGKYAGTKVILNKEEFLLLREDELLGILVTELGISPGSDKEEGI